MLNFGNAVRITIPILRKNRLFMKLLRWDVTPAVLFKPRFVDGPEDTHLAAETEGYMFYIDYFGKGNPLLMIMRTTSLVSSSFAQVLDCPAELLLEAVKQEGVKSYSGMYPIDEKLEELLKEKLGFTSRGQGSPAARPS